MGPGQAQGARSSVTPGNRFALYFRRNARMKLRMAKLDF